MDIGNLTKGEFNVHWKGGISQYPNHHKLKKARLRVLKAVNYTCSCGGVAIYAKHKDGDAANFNDDNLLPLCKSCFYSSIEGRGRKRLLPGQLETKSRTSKFTVLYGMTIRGLADLFGVSFPTIQKWHKKGALNQRLAERSFYDGSGI